MLAIDALGDLKGSNTGLITFTVSPHADLVKVRKKIGNEIREAQNIKDKGNRRHVLESLAHLQENVSTLKQGDIDMGLLMAVGYCI